jgi:arginyl-tRNA synthetase
MDVHALLHARVVAALTAMQRDGALPTGLDLAAVEVAPPRDQGHGDLASNAGMVLAKAAKMKPRDIAERLAARLRGEADIASLEVAGPGFVNIRLRPAFWQGLVATILREGAGFGRAAFGGGALACVEYVSANPTGPMHVGHSRGAAFGDALANLLAFVGFNVTREYYINDAGAQVDRLARSAYLRYREALGEEIGEIPAGLYPGEYLKPVGEALAKAHGRRLLDAGEECSLPLVRDVAVASMLARIKEDLAMLGIRHEVFFSERSLLQDGDQVAAAVQRLREKGWIYQGRLPQPKGHVDPEWEEREQTLFRSTAFGDDVDRALLKSDGSYTYFATDVAYHDNKLRRGFKHLIDVFGADHAGHLMRLRAAVKALSDGKADIDIKVCQLVRLLRAGEPLRMSKRAGAFVTLREVVDEVGSDPVRFMMLFRKNDAPLDFDLAKVVEQSKDNPVFYVQYAHARAASALRNAQQIFPELKDEGRLAGSDLTPLVDAGELDLMRRLAVFPGVIAGAARAHEPHRLAFYLYDLASAFHLQWTRGNELPHLRFIQPDDGILTAARIALITANRLVLASGLALLGVHAPVEMR